MIFLLVITYLLITSAIFYVVYRNAKTYWDNDLCTNFIFAFWISLLWPVTMVWYVPYVICEIKVDNGKQH